LADKTFQIQRQQKTQKKDFFQMQLAVAFASEQLRKNPRQVVFLNGRAVIFQGIDRFDLSERDLNKAIEIKPNYAAAYFNRARVYYHRGQSLKARTDLIKATELEPSNGRFWAALAFQDFSLHRYKDSIFASTKALACPQKEFNVESLVNRCACYCELAQFEKAVDDATKALRLDPKNSFALRNRALAYQHLGELELALGDLDESIRLDPNSGLTFKIRSEVLMKLGQHEQAIADAARSSDLPALDGMKKPMPKVERSSLLHTIESSSKMLEKFPDDFGCRFDRIIAEICLKRYADADKDLQCLNKHKECSERSAINYLLLRNVVIRKLGDEASAKQLLLDYAIKHPESANNSMLLFFQNRLNKYDVFAKTKSQDLSWAMVFVGYHSLLRGDKKTAKEMFESVLIGKFTDIDSYSLAYFELQALKAQTQGKTISRSAPI
jgi:Flp pilus assembly protein TadD